MVSKHKIGKNRKSKKKKNNIKERNIVIPLKSTKKNKKSIKSQQKKRRKYIKIKKSNTKIFNILKGGSNIETIRDPNPPSKLLLSEKYIEESKEEKTDFENFDDINKIVQNRKKFNTEREKELDQEYTISVNEGFIRLFQNKVYVESKITEHKIFVKNILNDPYKNWKLLSNRFRVDKTKSFPELEGVIVYLIYKIFDSENIKIVKDNTVLFNLREQILIKIMSVMYESRIFLPYEKTIETISDILFYFDTLSRIKENIDNPYFHTRRYYYYQEYLLKQLPENIVIPTIYSLGATDLIKSRCVPIWFCGVGTELVFVDEYYNTPIEFYMHDIQHCRRMYYHNNEYFDTVFKYRNHNKSRSVYDLENKDNFFKSMCDFTKKIILPLIILKKKDSEMNKALKKIKKMIIFEIIHESALTVNREVICENILLGLHNTPVEKVILKNTYSDIENEIYKDPSILGNLMYKLKSSFFDEIDDQKAYIVPVKYRTSEWVSIAAMQLLKELCESSEDPTKLYNKLIRLSCDKTNKPEEPDKRTLFDKNCELLKENETILFEIPDEKHMEGGNYSKILKRFKSNLLKNKIKRVITKKTRKKNKNRIKKER